jgi:exonuclease SbcC
MAADRALARTGFPDRDTWEAACMDKDDQAALAARSASYAGSGAASAARLAAARRAVDGSSRPDTTVLQAVVSEAEVAHNLARTALSQAESELRLLESSLSALATARARREALRERGDRLVELAGLLNGDTAGRRLSFRNFVLARYFSRVALRASVRLREMSEGRYDIRVVEGRSRGQGRIGLDLEVMDSFTGRSRPASSLSGGEKFLTSISLALGLSDVITRRSGGIALDSIFIDEGFGSLDDETLDRAVAVLDRIRGQRVIGIVSHVGELRTRIPARIEVDKTGNGSSLRIIGG